MNKNNEVVITVYTEKGKETLTRTEFYKKLPRSFDGNAHSNYVTDLLTYGEAEYKEQRE